MLIGGRDFAKRDRFEHMKRKTGLWLIIMSLLLGACGNTERESLADEGAGKPETESREENGSQNFEEQEDWEQEREQGVEQPVEEPVMTPVPIPEKPTYISQEFLNQLSQFLMGETDLEALKEFVFDQRLSEEELEAYAADPVVAEFIQRVDNSWKGGVFLRADGDNDGIEDLLAWINDGGSMGNNSRYFLKGQADGSFEYTCSTAACTQEITFVRYNETTYLLETDFDYLLKAFNGFIVTLYQDGEVLETLSLTKEMESYEPEIVSWEAGYEEAAQKYAEDGRNGFWGDWGYGDWGYVNTGTAEELIEWETVQDILGKTADHSRIFCSDFDNDGQMEWYWKSVYEPSNISTSLCLWETLYEENAGGEEVGKSSILLSYELEYKGVPVFFWVDSIGGKQILLLLCYKGIDREMLYGYLIEEDTVATVLEINYTGVPVIEYDIYTKGINYNWDPWNRGMG